MNPSRNFHASRPATPVLRTAASVDAPAPGTASRPSTGPTHDGWRAAGWHQRAARRLLFELLEKLEHGEVIIQEGGRAYHFGRRTDLCPLGATVRIHDAAAYPVMVLGGNVGAGRAYIEGLWSADDLTTLVRIFAVNQSVLSRLDGGWSWITKPIDRLYHAQRRNSRSGSRRNIAAHYDLGNEFFELFLDETMMYSSAWFERPETDLATASRAKLRRLCEKLTLGPADHVIEIGTGWGGFAEFAARHYGCRVTTTTISPSQYAYARRRIDRAGLADRVTVLKQDYRDLQGRYDKLVSIEMIEAVGAEHYGTFFGACDRLLRPDGLMALQAIVIPDQLYEQARRSVDYIKRFIFPGGCLPSIGAMSAAIGKHTDMQIAQIEDITPHYARTLRLWRERFMARRDEIVRLGFDESFIRMWEYYFCYCEGGFRERVIGDVQMVMAKPMWRGHVPLPAAERR